MASNTIKLLTVASLLLTVLNINVSGKVYERCELARELRDLHEIPDNQISTWVCLARYESEFNTSAVNSGSGDHGIFQLSQLFWCSPPGYACGISCNDLHDDNLEDDVICARRVYREHRRLTGNGFNAWVVYHQYCKDQSHADTFIKGCFEDTNLLRQEVDTTVKDLPRLPAIDYFPHIIKLSTTEKDLPKLPTIDYYPHIIKPTTNKDLQQKTTVDYYPHIIKSTTEKLLPKLPTIDYYPHIIKPTNRTKIEIDLPKKSTIDYYPHIIKTSTEKGIYPYNPKSTTKKYVAQSTRIPFTFKPTISTTYKPYSFKTSTIQYTTTPYFSTTKRYNTKPIFSTTIKPIYFQRVVSTTSKPFTFKHTTTKPLSIKTTTKPYSFQPFTILTTKISDVTNKHIVSTFPAKRIHRLVGNKKDYAFSMSSNGFQLFKTDAL